MGTVCVKGEKIDKNQPISEVLSKRINGVELLIQKGDIVELKVDAIVNPYDQKNTERLVKTAGTKIEQEISKFADVPKGQAFITEAGNLQAKHLIHLNLVSWQGVDVEKEAEKIKESVDSIIKVALEHKLVSLGFPDMFTGPFVAPIQVGSKVLLEKLIQFCNEKSKDVSFERFHIISQDQTKLKVYANELDKLTLNIVNTKPDEQQQQEEKPKEEEKNEGHHHHHEEPKKAAPEPHIEEEGKKEGEHLESEKPKEENQEEKPKETHHEEAHEKNEEQHHHNEEQHHHNEEQHHHHNEEQHHNEEKPVEEPHHEEKPVEEHHEEKPVEEHHHEEKPVEEHHEEHHEEKPVEEPPKEEEKPVEEPPKEEEKPAEEPPKEEEKPVEEQAKEEGNNAEEKKEENAEEKKDFTPKLSYDEIKKMENQENNNEEENPEIIMSEEKPKENEGGEQQPQQE